MYPELIDEKVCMQLFQFFGILVSIIGIFVVFRITSTENQIRDTLEVLKNVFVMKHNFKIAHSPCREKIERTILWIQQKHYKGNNLPYPVGKENEWYEIRNPIDDFFNQKFAEEKIINSFAKLLIIWGLTLIILLLGFYPLQKWKSWIWIDLIIHIIIILLILSFFLFIRHILLTKSNFKVWKKNRKEWETIRAEVEKSFE